MIFLASLRRICYTFNIKCLEYTHFQKGALSVHLGIPEIILILIVILLFVGPKKLPEAGEALGKAMRSFRRAFSGETDKGADAKPDDQTNPPDGHGGSDA